MYIYWASEIKSSWETSEECFTGSVEGTSEGELSASAVISVLSVVTDGQEASSELISKLSLDI